MPPTLPIDISNFPAFQTRKALLIIDLQNEFLATDSTLFVSEPVGYLERGLNMAKKFRESGAGDVFWIRSQFDAHRPTANAHIITSSTPPLSGSRTASNGSGGSVGGGPRGPPGNPEPNQDADPEAFLSIAGTADLAAPHTPSTMQNHPMLPGSFGCELAPQAAAAINARQDLVIAKSHYSAFESTRLLTCLRTRFITELYIFGALTNISIYATALDAARHGLMLTIVEDCCGYRDAMRHNNALQSLIRLTGCDTILADHVLETLPTASARPHGSLIGAPSSSGLPSGGSFAAAIAAITASGHGPPGARHTGSGTLPVRSKIKREGSSSPSPSSYAADPSALPSSSLAPLARAAEPRILAGVSSSPTAPLSVSMPPHLSIKDTPTSGHVPIALEGELQSGFPVVTVEEKVGLDSSDGSGSTRPERSTVNSAIEAVLTSRLVCGPTSDETDAGKITPNGGSNASEAENDLDDSFIPVLPSSSAKTLEYSRLRAKHQADILKRQQQEEVLQDAGGDGIVGSKTEGSRSHYQADFQPVRVHRNASRPVKANGVSSGTEIGSQPGSSADRNTLSSEITTGTGTFTAATKQELKAHGVVEASNDPSLEVTEPNILGHKTPATGTPKPESGQPDVPGLVIAAEAPNISKTAGTSEAVDAAQVSQNTRNGTPDAAHRRVSSSPTPKMAQPDSAASLAVDMAKKPAATEPICAGDTIIYHNVLPVSLVEGIYDRLRDELQWQRMSHQGGDVPRLVCVQGGVETMGSGDGNDDDAIPVYRHPADELPPLECFSPTVQMIKQHIEAIVGHPLNHALIQHYRSGNDYISEHSDKTLDIVPGSYVCNVSFGAERMMIFRTKRLDKDLSRALKETASSKRTAGLTDDTTGDGKGSIRDKTSDDNLPTAMRQSCRFQLPHNSLCRMGLQTNMKWLHAIRQDKRADRDKSEPEMAFGGGRISLTFRRIGTFINKSETIIWGQGAIAKTRAEARPVINGQSDEAISMLRAFGIENHSSSFDWARYYGGGFDVLHMSSAPRFFASTDKLVNSTIQLLLAELGIRYARGSLGGGRSNDLVIGSARDKDGKCIKDGKKATDVGPEEVHLLSSLETAVRFVDNDRDRCTVHGFLAILLYVDSVYGATALVPSSSKQSTSRQKLEIAQVYTRLQQAILLQDSWRLARLAPALAFSLESWKKDLVSWNAFVTPTPHTDMAGRDGTSGKSSITEILFIAGGSSPALADYALWPVLHGMEQAFITNGNTSDASSDSTPAQPQEPPPTFQAELQRMDLPYLAKYYTQLKARASFGNVMLAGDRQGR